MIREAVILAAGKGTRLKELSRDRPKGFLELNGSPIVEMSVKKLIDRGIGRIIIGTGHCSGWYDDLARKYPTVETVFNPRFSKTGSMGTLECCAPLTTGDILLLESDLIYDSFALAVLISDPRGSVILGAGRSDSGDEVFIGVDGHLELRSLSKTKVKGEVPHAELVGISKLSQGALQAMCRFAASHHRDIPRMDYEAALVGAKEQGEHLHVRMIEDLAWCEIDDAAQLERATKLILPKILENEGLRPFRELTDF